MIALKNIYKGFHLGTVNENIVFTDFNFQVGTGDFVSIVGSNGSGKTTLLNLVAGSLTPDLGEILINNQNVTGQKEFARALRYGRVFQNPSVGVAGDLTVAENMALAENKGKTYGLGFALTPKKIEKYKEMLSSLGLGLEEKINQKIGALSGGQRQAISLLMATMTPIDLLILDEHTAALDPKTADIIMELTDKIVKEKHLTALMVTHNLRYAVEYGNRIVMMHNGKAVLDCQGEEKAKLEVKDLLQLFNTISIECGN